MQNSPTIEGFLQCNGRKLEEAGDFKCVFVILLSNNSLFVGQLFEDKSLGLYARDKIFFTNDLQTVNYYSTIHC